MLSNFVVRSSNGLLVRWMVGQEFVIELLSNSSNKLGNDQSKTPNQSTM